MSNLLSRLTMASPSAPQSEVRAQLFARKKPAVSLVEPVTEHEPEGRVSIFVNPKALTIPIVVGLVKVAWASFGRLPVPALHTIWTPFILCVAIGLVITFNNLKQEQVTGSMYALGLLVGLLNSCVMFAAVIGIPQ